MNLPIIERTSKAQKLVIIIILIVFGLIFSSVLGIAINMICGIPNESRNGIRILQICNQLLMFVFPPLAYAALTKHKPLKALGFNKIPAWSLIALPVMYICLPIISDLSLWNDSWTLPESMKPIEDILRSLQDTATVSMEKLLRVNGIGGLILNLFMIAGLAAFGEEMLFRSLLQPFLVKICKNVHIGIILTAIIFSAAHFEFYGFIPRIVLGLILGYSFYFSGTIWLPMILHFLNNATIVILVYLNNKGVTNIDEEKFGSTDNVFILIGSLVLMIAIFIFMNILKTKKNNTNREVDLSN